MFTNEVLHNVLFWQGTKVVFFLLLIVLYCFFGYRTLKGIPDQIEDIRKLKFPYITLAVCVVATIAFITYCNYEPAFRQVSNRPISDMVNERKDPDWMQGFEPNIKKSNQKTTQQLSKERAKQSEEERKKTIKRFEELKK